MYLKLSKTLPILGAAVTAGLLYADETETAVADDEVYELNEYKVVSTGTRTERLIH